MKGKYKMLLLLLSMTTAGFAESLSPMGEAAGNSPVGAEVQSVASAAQKESQKKITPASAAVVNLTESEFLSKVYDYKANPDKWTYKGNKPAIIDFYADWCGPCRMLSPILQRLAARYKDRIVIYKVNTEKERNLSAAFGITSLPTLLFVPLNETPQVAMGALPEQELEKAIEEVLLKKKTAR